MSIKLLFGTNWPQLVGHQTSLTLQDYFGVLFRPGGNVSIDNEQSDLQLCVWWWGGGGGVWEQAIRETCYLELTSLYVVRWRGMLGRKLVL